jgi:hypothetical protein
VVSGSLSHCCTHSEAHCVRPFLDDQELGRIVLITLAGFASSILPRSFEDVKHMIMPWTLPELKPGRLFYRKHCMTVANSTPDSV